MPPKKKAEKGGKKKADAEAVEPALNPAWEQAVETGTWSAPVEELPDPGLWPTWGALRERVLGATKCDVGQCPGLTVSTQEHAVHANEF